MEFIIQLLPFIFLIGVMYLIIIRPQQQQQKRHQKMVDELAKGDKIVTTGGLIAEVKKVEEQFFTVTLNQDVTVKLVKEAVARKYEDEA